MTSAETGTRPGRQGEPGVLYFDPTASLIQCMRNHLLRPRRAATVLVAAGLISLLADPIAAQRQAVPAKPDTRTIVHVLNRIAFGPAPGDIERVRQMGLTAYIDQQLNPERMANPALDQRLAEFASLNLSTRELADQFFIPADQARRMQQQQQRQAQPGQATGQGQSSRRSSRKRGRLVRR